MQGLVSIIPEPFYQQIESIWDELEIKFGLVGFLVSPIPHISWHIAEQYDFDQAEKSILAAIKKITPLHIRTTGIGLFTGIRQVVYIPVVKDCELIEIHRQIWSATQPHSFESNQLYNPDNWVPHITIIHENLTEDNIGPVIKYLAGRSFSWEMKIDQLAFITDAENEKSSMQIISSFSLVD